MFLRSLTSPDPRYRDLEFRSGLNILVSDRTYLPGAQATRSGTGKSSVVRLLRYMFSGEQSDALQSSALENFPITLNLEWHDSAGSVALFSVLRELGNTKVELDGSPGLFTHGAVDEDAWTSWQREVLFALPDEDHGVKVAQLWGQLLRTNFHLHASQATPMSLRKGMPLGYLLGLDAQVLADSAKRAEVVRDRRRTAEALLGDAVPGLPVDQATLRARLADVCRQRDAVQEELASFQVDRQYERHHDEADELSREIERLNNRRQVHQEKLRRLNSTLVTLQKPESDTGLPERLRHAYQDQGVSLPDMALRRFDEVRAFHDSLVRNRKQHVAAEASELESLIAIDQEEVRTVDARRSEVLRLLDASTALDTFLEAQRSLADLQQQVSRLEQQLALAEQLDTEDTEVEVDLIRSRARVSQTIAASSSLALAMSRYAELVRRVCRDRSGDLIVRPGRDGEIEVLPTIEGDFSPGVGGVKIFAQDTAVLISAMTAGRAPGLLVHDSHLFDAMDDRRVARCLETGAELAEQHNYQYIVTIDSDKLTQVSRETTMDLGQHVLEPRLTDATEDGGLFGFRFG